MNSSFPIEVAVAANSGYFDGLAVVLESLLRSNRENIFRVHVIDGGLRAGERRFILLRIKRHNALNEVLFHAIENHHFQGFRLDYGNSYMTYARMLIGSLVDSSKVLYLDTDLLVAADVRPLWETPLEEAIVAAAPDPSIRSLRDDYPLEGECGDEPYFNAGVMLINLSKWREENVQSELFQMIGREPGKFKWWDQTAMNALFRRRVHLLDPEWNAFADRVRIEAKPYGNIYHYVGPSKPWNKYLDTVEFVLWRAFYRRYVRSAVWLLRTFRFSISMLRHVRHRCLNAVPLVPALRKQCRNEHRDATLIGGGECSSPGDKRTTDPTQNTTVSLESFLQIRWG